MIKPNQQLLRTRTITLITIIVDVAVEQIITIMAVKTTETIVVAVAVVVASLAVANLAVAVASRVAAVSHVVVVVIITTITITIAACITIVACITFITSLMNVLALVHSLAAVDAHRVVAADVLNLVAAVVDVWTHSVVVPRHVVVDYPHADVLSRFPLAVAVGTQPSWAVITMISSQTTVKVIYYFAFMLYSLFYMTADDISD